MLFIVTRLIQLRDRRWLEKQANTLASRLTELVTPTLSPVVLHMPKAEARGYVRAKCRPVVDAEVAQLAAGRPGLKNAGAAVQTLIEQVIRMVLDDVAHGRVHRGERRRAA